jgi:hypothetical protein
MLHPHPHDWHQCTLMLVCWKGGPSPIHNHASSDSLMCVARGEQAVTLHCYIPPYFEIKIIQQINIFRSDLRSK